MDSLKALAEKTHQLHMVCEDQSQCEVIANVLAALQQAADAALEEAVEACRKAVPRAHTYASENADVYRAGDHARDKCIAAIQVLSARAAIRARKGGA